MFSHDLESVHIDMYTQAWCDRWKCYENTCLWQEPSEMSDKIIVSSLNVQNDMIFRLIRWIPVTRLILIFHYLIILLRCPYAWIKQEKQALWRNRFQDIFASTPQMSDKLVILSFTSFVWSLIQDDRTTSFVPTQILRSNTFSVVGCIMMESLA